MDTHSDQSRPALRPRMFGVIDESGLLRRINLAHIAQWWRVPERGVDRPVLVILLSIGDGLMYRIPDPHGEVDKALCSAFFDCTLDSLI